MAALTLISRRLFRYLAAFLILIPMIAGSTYCLQWSAGELNEFFDEAYLESFLTVRVRKVWSPETGHPGSVTVQLFKDGAPAEGGTVTLDESNQWTKTWYELEKGHQWTVDEINVPAGYSKTVVRTEKDNSVIEFIITNTKTGGGNPPGGENPPGGGNPPDKPKPPVPEYPVPGDPPPTGSRPPEPDRPSIYDPNTPGGDYTPPNPADLPKTGDETDPVPWLIIAAVSAIILRDLLFFDKRRKKGEG